jgi:uncharacterized Zn finger protein (UPF0148 family)
VVEQLLYCPECGAKLVEEEVKTSRRAEEVPPPPVKPVEKRKLEPSEAKIVRKAEERLKLLERFLSSAARIPVVLTDPGQATP